MHRQRLPDVIPLASLALVALAVVAGAHTQDVPLGRSRGGAPQAPLPSVQHAGPPAAPVWLRVVPVDGKLRAEWASAARAHAYTVYVGLFEAFAPSDAVLAVAAGAANEALLDGLVDGTRYFVTVSATGLLGEGPPSPAVGAVFGPHGPVSGRVVVFVDDGSGLAAARVSVGGAIVRLTDTSDPLAPPHEASTRGDGRFQFAPLRTGTYTIEVERGGSVHALPTPLVLTADGAALDPLDLPSASAPGAVLVGTIGHADGRLAHVVIPEFGIDQRAAVTAALAGGGSVPAIVDDDGNWLIEGLASADYPLTVEASFQGLAAGVAVAAPTVPLAPLELTFAEPLPDTMRVSASQNGGETLQILSGVPVTFAAEVENPGGLPLDPHWVATFNGETFVSTELTPTFIFVQPPGPPPGEFGDPLDSGAAIVRCFPTLHATPLVGANEYIVFDPDPVLPHGYGCWSGTAVSWRPEVPKEFQPGHAATVTVTHSGAVSPMTAATSATAGGYFELPLDPQSVPPYLVRVEKLGYMRFLWPFPERLPKEAQFQVIPATSFFLNSSSARSLIHPLGAVLTLPQGSLLDPASQPYFGSVVVEMVVLGKHPNPAMPFPPTPELRGGPGFRRGIIPYQGIWIDIRTSPGNVSLTPTSAAKLTFPYGPFGFGKPAAVPCYHQVETTGYFERHGYTFNDPESIPSAWLTVPGQYEIPLGKKGLFLIGDEQPLTELLVSADRTLNYPVQLRVGTGPFRSGIFPIVLHGPTDLSIGKLVVPQTVTSSVSALELRHAPGNFFADADFPLWPVEPMEQHVISSIGVTPPYVIPGGPLPVQSVQLSLTTSEPQNPNPILAPKLGQISGANQWFSRGIQNDQAAAQQYYTQIRAPQTLDAWRTLNGLPYRFGAPLVGVPATDYATAYYYNLGDLGFARAQTMRIQTSTVDGLKDVAYAVTNYRTLEDARCGRGAIATVCMDFAARVDDGQTQATRYTRFYVYGANGQLVTKANLDGAGDKFVPNLCVMCHGGTYWQNGGPNQSSNLGSRFLPFDLESYTYHPKFGVQHAELAKMNAGVLLTAPTQATQELIGGWYNGSPNANPFFFDQDHVPLLVNAQAGWQTGAEQALYRDVFKASCRVCHNSRESGGVQFATHSAFQGYGFGKNSALAQPLHTYGSNLQMPHSQRTWGIFWGSRNVVNLEGPVVPDMPAVLGNQ